MNGVWGVLMYLEEGEVAGSDAPLPLQRLHHDGRETVPAAR